MLKHFIENDIYYICDINGATLVTIKLANDLPGEQLIIETPTEVYAGPLNLLTISEFTKK